MASNQSLCRVADSRSHRIGRPSRLTPAVTERLLHALRTGNARVVACRYAGISEPTFHRWMADDRPEFREFRVVVEQGEAPAEVGVVANLVELAVFESRCPIRVEGVQVPEPAPVLHRSCSIHAHLSFYYSGSTLSDAILLSEI